MTTPLTRITSVAASQAGVISRGQARQLGVSDSQLRHRVRSGALERIGTNTFRFPGVDPNHEALLRALVLDVKGMVWVSGRTAAALYGFDGFELEPPFHVTIERGRDVKRVGHKIHTTRVLPECDQAERLGFLTMRPARVLIDMARDTPVDQLTTAVESALRDRWTSEAALRRRAVELQSIGRFGLDKLLAILDERARKLGAHSWLEAEFLRLIEVHGMPRPHCQQVMGRAEGRVVRVDFRFPGTNLVVEVLGYRFHRDKREMQRDADRLNALILDGYRPLQFTYEDVTARALPMVETIQRALLSANVA